MNRKLLFGLFSLLIYCSSAIAQGGSESELKSQASSFFEQNNYKEAKLLYAQLLSLYPKDPTYNYRYGACVLQTEADKTKPLKYLEFAASKATVDPLAYYYLGRAHHLNYEFASAVKLYSKFKNKAKADQKEKYDVDRQIEMAKNGNKLLAKLNEVQVIERKEIAEKDFYRLYDESVIGGKILAKTEDFQSKYDKKSGEKSVMYFPNNAKEVYYSSYGKKGENGKDIYKAVKLGNGEWSEGVSLGSSINTKYDEDFAYIRPDGRTLYFASKGHTSMGGYDIFKSVRDDATGEWTEPENLDFAFSSADDDIMFVTDNAGITAYFASNRANEFGKITVYKVLTERIPAELSAIQGKFISESNPEEKTAKITVIDKATKETIGVYETDNSGNYTIEIAQNGGDYQFNIETTENAPIHTGVVTIPRQDEFEVLGQELRLVGSGDEQQLVIKNIFDGTAVAVNGANGQGPKISSDIIKMKANLAVNYDASDLAALKERMKNELANNNETNEVVENSDVEEVEKEIPVKVDNTEVVLEETTDLDEQTQDDSIIEETPESSNINAEEIAVAVAELKSTANKEINEKQNLINNQYAKSYDLQQQAEDLFEEAESLKANGANSVDVELKEKEAGILALKSAFAAQIAQEIESSINQDLFSLSEIESEETSIQQAIEEDNLAEAELKFNNLNLNATSDNSLEQLIEEQMNSLNENDLLANKKIEDFSAKNSAFNTEKANLSAQLTTLEAELENASKNKKEEIEQNIAATKLDLEDLGYQGKRLEQDLISAELSKKTINIEQGELLAAKKQIGASENVTPITEEQKESLIGKLKDYRDQGQLAYSSENELYRNEVEIPTAVANTGGNSITNNSTNSVVDNGSEEISTPIVNAETKSLPEINSEYESALQVAESSTPEETEKVEQKIQVYEEWISSLENKKTAITREFDAEIDESERALLQTEIDEVTTSLVEKKKAKSLLDSDLIALKSDNFVPKADAISSVNEINSGTVVADDFTNFKFDQGVEASTASSAESLTEAKRTLFEAGELAKQSEQAQQSAYSLPTAEERTQAFTKANELKTLSEQKQLAAAKQFAAFNLKEFRVNKQKISNANQFDERYNTASLEMAELLGEEAETYFTDAAVIRANVNEEGRLSQKQVDLQKAYDYEMLALKKQKEALSKLGNVVSEVVNKQLGKAPEAAKKPFVQVIDKPEILALVTSSAVNEKIKTLQAEVISIDEEVEKNEKLAYDLDSGAEEDSINAEITALKTKKENNLNDVALLMERDRQIKEGLVGVDPVNSAPENKVLAYRKAAVLNQVSIDTVEVNADRKNVILSSQGYTAFANNRQELANQVKAAELLYQEAVELAEANNQLRKEAIIATNKAEATTDANEKQRLVKAAQVINQTIASNEQSIEAINKNIKVKNFTVISLEKKDQAALANLSEAEKREYQVLAKEIIPQDLATVTPTETLKSAEDTNTNSNQVVSTETAKATENLPELTSSDNNLEVSESEDDTVAEFTEEVNTAETTPVIDEPVEVIEPVSVEEPTSEESVTETEFDKTPEITNLNTSEPISIKNIDVVPQKIKQAIFVTLNRNESAYNDEKPIPTKASLPQGIVYKVQIGAFRQPIAQSTFKGFAPLMKESAGNGITRYTAGLFGNESSALKARNEIRQMGYSDAFVVAFKNGKRISIAAARGETGETVDLNKAENFNNITSNTASSSQTSNENLNSSKPTPVKGGSKEALNPSFNSAEVAEVVNTETVEGLIFTVQIGVYSKPVTKGTFDYSDLNVVEISDNLYRYNAGLFTSAISAAELKNTISSEIPDAFVAAYYNGKRVSLEEASKLK